MSLKDEIIRSYKTGGTLTKLIYINIAIFLVVKLVELFLVLMALPSGNWLQYAMLPASPAQWLMQPWTILSYMFVHEGFFHILFNVLCLYWFGRLFLLNFNQKQLVGLYILGGLLGGVSFIVCYNIFPYFQPFIPNGYLLGASASVLAIAIGIACYNPNMEIRMLFFGNVKLKYIAIIFFLLSLLGITEKNGGGDLAHLGGMLAGYLFALRIKKGRDITLVINRILDFFVNIFTRKPGLKVKYPKKKAKTTTDSDWNARKKEENDELNQILEKIKESGYSSLNSEEKKRLFEKSK